MRIDYNILWFENDADWLKPQQRTLNNFLDDYGFRLKVVAEKDSSNLDSLLSDIANNLSDIDIIFMDYRLAQEETGDSIIRRIRENQLFTEIIFYSQNTNVKDVIERVIGSVEGIYYAGRDIFIDKAKAIIQHSIKKVQEVNTMRGLIMAAESDLAGEMLEIIEKNIDHVDNGNEIVEYIFDICNEFLDIKSADFQKYVEEKNVNDLINDTLIFDSYKKARVLQRIIKLAKNQNLTHLKNFCEDYNKDVIQPRNAFAHVTPQIENGKKVLIPKRGKAITFTDETCIAVRKKLIVHAENITLIKQVVSQK